MPRKTGNLMALLNTMSEDDLLGRAMIADSLLRQMLPVLKYLKLKRVIHRDIKPENILWEHRGAEDYDFFLSDFGLVKDLTLGSGHSLRGATAFIAPEMRNPQIGCQGPGLDCWSLFVVEKSMYFPVLVRNRIKYWTSRATPGAKDAAGLIARTRWLAEWEPGARWDPVLAEKHTFLEGPLPFQTDWMTFVKELPSLRALADAELSVGLIKYAIGTLKDSVAQLGRTLPEENHERLTSEQELATVYLETERIKEAIDLLEHITMGET